MSETVIFIESGRKRKGEKVNCKWCKKEFIRRKNETRRNGKQREYCSVKCSGKSQRNKVEVKCFNCGCKIFRAKSKIKAPKHGFYFCSQKCKNEAQKIGGKCPEIRPSHYGTSVYDYKRIVGDDINKGCIVCEGKEKFKLTIHHIDSDRKNNARNNLEVLCWNHHASRHLKKTKNLLNGLGGVEQGYILQ